MGNRGRVPGLVRVLELRTTTPSQVPAGAPCSVKIRNNKQQTPIQGIFTLFLSLSLQYEYSSSISPSLSPLSVHPVESGN